MYARLTVCLYPLLTLSPFRGGSGVLSHSCEFGVFPSLLRPISLSFPRPRHLCIVLSYLSASLPLISSLLCTHTDVLGSHLTRARTSSSKNSSPQTVPFSFYHLCHQTAGTSRLRRCLTMHAASSVLTDSGVASRTPNHTHALDTTPTHTTIPHSRPPAGLRRSRLPTVRSAPPIPLLSNSSIVLQQGFSADPSLTSFPLPECPVTTKDDHTVPFGVVPSLWLSEHSEQLPMNLLLNSPCLCATLLPSLLSVFHPFPPPPLPQWRVRICFLSSYASRTSLVFNAGTPSLVFLNPPLHPDQTLTLPYTICTKLLPL